MTFWVKIKLGGGNDFWVFLLYGCVDRVVGKGLTGLRCGSGVGKWEWADGVCWVKYN